MSRKPGPTPRKPAKTEMGTAAPAAFARLRSVISATTSVEAPFGMRHAHREEEQDPDVEPPDEVDEANWSEPDAERRADRRDRHEDERAPLVDHAPCARRRSPR